MKKYITSSADETKRVGEMLSSDLQAGDVVLLSGDLGAGKTVIASGIVGALTQNSYTVTSPTFTIVNQYDGTGAGVNVNHFDFYRIESPDELDNIGIYEYLYSDSVNLIEWSERAPEVIGDDLRTFHVYIKKLSDTKREITIDCVGEV